MSEYSPIEPISVVAEVEAGKLLVTWSDEQVTEYPIEWLRWQCPCALCRGEMGMPGRLQFTDSLTPEETRLEDVQPVGRYALMLYWGDGHHDGIYTYNWLRSNSQAGMQGNPQP